MASGNQQFYFIQTSDVEAYYQKYNKTERYQSNSQQNSANAQRFALDTIRELASQAHDLEQACIKAWERVAVIAAEIDTKLSLEAWRRLTNIHPTNPRYWRERSAIALQAGSLDEAKKSAAKAEEIAF